MVNKTVRMPFMRSRRSERNSLSPTDLLGNSLLGFTYQGSWAGQRKAEETGSTQSGLWALVLVASFLLATNSCTGQLSGYQAFPF